MIGWNEIYKVVVAMAPLYVALALGYGSIRWWKIFSKDQCDAVNRLVCYFTLPLFTFDFTAHIDPFHMNYLFIGGDAVSRLIVVVVLVFWAKLSNKGSYEWSITSCSLSTMTNSLIIGVPLLEAMYGKIGVDLVVQSSVLQSILWFTILLFVLEVRRSGGSAEVVDSHTLPEDRTLEDLEANEVSASSRLPFWSLMKKVWIKLAKNPNSYACTLGVAWAFVAARWQLEMPSIMEKSVLIMSKAGTGTAMFSMGMFMAQQEKLIACGTRLTLLGMVLRFIAGPTAMAIGAISVGLRGDVLRIAIIQAALPQAIASFIFAKEYGFHAEVLSTAVIFGMMVSLPVLIAYYAVLELL
uniref:Auxin efflux carrier component n=1 Tax=Kalanchoe fedtschenkoi TaxID=63787 RepID=A0A7N0U6L2_KALFE